MSRFYHKAAVAVFSASLLTGALAIPSIANATSYVCKYQEKHSSKTGTVVGAVAGGAIGGSLADTHNKGLGTVAGAVVGGLIGSKVGRNHGKESCENERAWRERTVWEKDSHGHRHKVVYKYVDPRR
ncbi:glycine zipper 2TM domain-containing protein [Asticcacaulis sp. EMRT-3]|uniref:glycine zipper 2TM domain-containing protein n=1 Tax=Asticcacaulis sp. EMRT-3 TaxID=3040349 RepID=UPI0024AE9EC1|nr:glycine zipper 2TM domain-containing protein [Asticcacaulis sp. EMRT-3]MDI7775851.1 glycine zipper 2TM domain-containing protein [Asticcacaulis sp. EMRT-3]